MGENEEVGNRQRGLPYVLACRPYHVVSRRGQVERCAPTQCDVCGQPRLVVNLARHFVDPHPRSRQLCVCVRDGGVRVVGCVCVCWARGCMHTPVRILYACHAARHTVHKQCHWVIGFSERWRDEHDTEKGVIRAQEGGRAENCWSMGIRDYIHAL